MPSSLSDSDSRLDGSSCVGYSGDFDIVVVGYCYSDVIQLGVKYGTYMPGNSRSGYPLPVSLSKEYHCKLIMSSLPVSFPVSPAFL